MFFPLCTVNLKIKSNLVIFITRFKAKVIKVVYGEHFLIKSYLQIVIGIGAKPAVGPFESLQLSNTVGGIQVA